MVKCLQCIKETTNPKFCSLSCSCKYNARLRVYPEPKKVNCLECEKETTNPKFCSHNCSASHNNKTRIFKDTAYKGTKKVNCCSCKKTIEVNIRSPINGCKCDGCRKKRYCMCCGAERGGCIRKDICKKYSLLSSLVKYFGFDDSLIGSEKVFKEFVRIKNILEEEYCDDGLSLPELAEKYGHGDIRNVSKIFKSLGIKTRTLSESQTNAFITNRREIHLISPNFKHGWHDTWNDKKVFYRSSYELNYCEILDKQKIDYEMEELKILYWDSQLQKQRVAIPDFYIPENNLIVEIKGDYTYDKQNMIDRIISFKKHGYEFRMILEGKEYIEETLP